MSDRLPTDIAEARLQHLIDRARRGALLPAEADQLVTGLRDLVRRLENEEDERAHDNIALRTIARQRDEADARIRELEAAIDATYRERAHLVAHLAALHPSHIGHTDPSAPDWAVITIETPAGQMTWHISARDMDLFAHVQPTNRICRGWDGHTTDEKYQRMRDLTEAAPNLLSLDVMADLQRKRITELEAEITRLTAGQCTHYKGNHDQHHTAPVTGCVWCSKPPTT